MGIIALLGSGCNWLLPITKYSENFWCQFIHLSQFKEGVHLGKIKTPAWRERGSIPIQLTNPMLKQILHKEVQNAPLVRLVPEIGTCLCMCGGCGDLVGVPGIAGLGNESNQKLDES